jgi:alginate O-acetyltransferase complex protein AlgI
MSYTIDVYRRKIPAVSNILDLACFIGFFPQMVAGPIVRAFAFLPQLQTVRRFSNVDVRGALVLFLTGFIKKACIADAIAPTVDRYFAAPWNFDTPSAWVGVLFYAIQIYCDFSGYTDMAIACARLLGYELTLNFKFPYIARDIADFWHRWHISLSSWLRDYLYIPLGGNRGTRVSSCIAISCSP